MKSILFAVCCLLAYTVPVRAESSPLSGLSAISVEIHVTRADATTPPILADALKSGVLLDTSIRNKVELEIRRSTTLRIVPDSATTLHVVLAVTVINNTQGRPAVYFCTVYLHVMEPARIVRSGVVTTMKSWESGESQSWGSDISVVRDMSSTLDVPLREFLNEYLTANPKP